MQLIVVIRVICPFLDNLLGYIYDRVIPVYYGNKYDFDLNNQVKPHLVLKIDALKINNSDFSLCVINQFRIDIGRHIKLKI